MTRATSFRLVLVCLAALGVASVIIGVVLACLHVAVENTFLTLSVMFTGESSSAP